MGVRSILEISSRNSVASSIVSVLAFVCRDFGADFNRIASVKLFGGSICDGDSEAMRLDMGCIRLAVENREVLLEVPRDDALSVTLLRGSFRGKYLREQRVLPFTLLLYRGRKRCFSAKIAYNYP